MIELHGRSCAFAGALVHRLEDGVRAKRHLADEHLIKNDANRKDVTPCVCFLAFCLFRRHVIGRTQKGSGHRDAGKILRVRNSEVHHDHTAGVVDHDVLRLEIAMHHAFRMRSIQRVANLADNTDRLFGRKFAAFDDPALQIAAIDVLHRDEFHAVGFADVENPHDVAMRDLPGENQLLLEAFEHGGRFDELRLNHFDRDPAVEFVVFCLVDGPHPALTENFKNFVAASSEFRTTLHERRRRSPSDHCRHIAEGCRRGRAGTKRRATLHAELRLDSIVVTTLRTSDSLFGFVTPHVC